MGIKVGKRVEPSPDGLGEGRTPTATGSDTLVPPAGAEDSSPWAIPSQLGRYDLGAVLGQGGMGRVYAAQDRVLQREVALKLMWRTDPALLMRFLREAQFQARLDHPNICEIFEVDASGRFPFIAMRRVRGLGLMDAALEMELDDLLDLMIQCALAVQAAHEAGLIHRDLKPSNILLEPAGPGHWKPVLLDFGLAKEMEGPGLTMGSRVLGTPAFMAPEQALGHGVSARSDLYSLGATFYAFLGGRTPFQADSAAELLLKQSQEEAPALRSLNPDVPPGLAQILRTCMEKEPIRRYGSALALAQDLRRLKAGTPIQARRRARRRTALWALAGTLGLGFLGAGAWLAFGPTAPPLRHCAGSPEHPIRVLLVAKDRGQVSTPWMASGLNTVTAEILRYRPNVLPLAPSAAEASREGAADVHALQVLANNHQADLVLQTSLETEGERHRFQVATLRTGERRVKILLDRTFTLDQYPSVESQLTRDLPRRLGIPPQPWEKRLPRLLETRKTLVQAMQLIYGQHNREADRTGMALLQRVIEKEPDFPPPHMALANVLNNQANEAVHQGRPLEAAPLQAQARREAERAIQLAPQDPEGFYSLMSVQLLKGDMAGAEASALQAQKLDPLSTGPYWAFAAVAIQRPGREPYLKALAQLQAAIRLQPDEHFGYYRLAQYQLDAGQFGAALENINQAIARYPDMEYAHVIRTNLLLWSGRTQEAETALKEALARLPNARLLKRNLVYSAYLRGDRASFGSRLANCQEIWPVGHSTHLFLEGLGHFMAGQRAQGEAHYREALAHLRAQIPSFTRTERASASVDLYLMGRVLAQGPHRAAAKPFIELADQLHPRRLRLAQRDPAFKGLWPEPEPWPGDELL